MVTLLLFYMPRLKTSKTAFRPRDLSSTPRVFLWYLCWEKSALKVFQSIRSNLPFSPTLSELLTLPISQGLYRQTLEYPLQILLLSLIRQEILSLQRKPDTVVPNEIYILRWIWCPRAKCPVYSILLTFMFIYSPVITFMECIYHFIPETNHVFMVYNVAVFLYLQFMLHGMLFRPRNILCIIIIIIIIPFISCMYGIYNFIPETNHVYRVYNFAALQYLQFCYM